MNQNAPYPLNQFAPYYLAGVLQPPPEECGYEDRYFDYVYTPRDGTLLADAVLDNEVVEIDMDADFYLTGWYISKATNAFLVELSDAGGYQLTDGFITATAISFDGSSPTPIMPAQPFPKGSLIQLRLREITGSDNSIQIVFKGYKRFVQ